MIEIFTMIARGINAVIAYVNTITIALGFPLIPVLFGAIIIRLLLYAIGISLGGSKDE